MSLGSLDESQMDNAVLSSEVNIRIFEDDRDLYVANRWIENASAMIE